MPQLKEQPIAKKSGKKFRVVEGHHYHGEYVFTKGMVLASKLPLDEIFRNKLEVVPNEMQASKGIHKDDFKLPNAGVESKGGVKLKHKRNAVTQNPEWEDEENVDEEAVAEAVVEPDEDSPKLDFIAQATDVTDAFPFVLEEAKDLRVLGDGDFYGVVQEDEPKKLLNGQPLKKKEVKRFVQQYLDE